MLVVVIAFQEEIPWLAYILESFPSPQGTGSLPFFLLSSSLPLPFLPPMFASPPILFSLFLVSGQAYFLKLIVPLGQRKGLTIKVHPGRESGPMGCFACLVPPNCFPLCFSLGKWVVPRLWMSLGSCMSGQHLVLPVY